MDLVWNGVGCRGLDIRYFNQDVLYLFVEDVRLEHKLRQIAINRRR